MSEKLRSEDVPGFPIWAETMVERVAKAIDNAVQQWQPGAPQSIKEMAARAAIEAMREPTAGMGTAMYAAWDAFGEDAIMGPEEAVAIYCAAIDAALK